MTERLTLRPLTEFDFDPLLETMDDEVVRWQGYPTDPDELRTFVRTWIGNLQAAAKRKQLSWLICDRATGEVVGCRTMTPYFGNERGRACEVGSSLKSGWRDKGYGTEELKGVLALATEHLGYGIVYAGTHPDNLRALRQYEKCGFTPHTRKPGYRLPGGEVVEAVVLRRQSTARRTCRDAVAPRIL